MGTLVAVLASARMRIPVVLLVDSGGAAQAISDYVVDGTCQLEKHFPRMDASKDRAPMEAALSELKALQVASEHALLHFFKLSSGVEMSTVLLTAIIAMLRTRPPEETARLTTHRGGARNTVSFAAAEGAASAAEVSLAASSRSEESSASGFSGDLGAVRASSCTNGVTSNGVAGSGLAGNGVVGHGVAGKNGAVAGAGSGGGEGESQLGQASRAMQDVATKHTKALNLAISWGRPEVARNLLLELGQRAADTPTASIGLQRALELRRVSIVRTILALPDMSCGRIVMGRLYTVNDPHEFLKSNARLQRSLARHMDTLFNPAKAHTCHSIYRKAVGDKVLGQISPIFISLIEESRCTRAHDIFFWAVIQGDDELAMVLWERCKRPIHVALLAARLCKAMEASGAIGQQRLAERAEWLEQLAVAAMDEAADEQSALRIITLSATDRRRPDQTLLDVALQCKCKAFLTQRHCKTTMDLWWRGGWEGSQCVLPPSFSWLALAFFSLFPLLNPLLFGYTDFRRRSARSGPGYKYGTRREREREAGVKFEALTTVVDWAHEEAKRNAEQTNRPDHAKRTVSQIELEASLNDQAWRQSIWSDSEGRRESLGEHGRRAARRGGLSATRHFLQRLRDFYCIPAVAFLLRFLFHMALLVVYAIRILSVDQLPYVSSLHVEGALNWTTGAVSSAFDERPPDIRAIEIVWLIFEAGVVIDAQHARVLHYRLGNRSEPNGFERVLNINNVVLLCAIACRVCSLVLEDVDVGHQIYQVYVALISLNSITVTLGVLPFLSRFHVDFGVLVVIVERMILDVILFLELFIVVAVAFSLAFFGLGRAGLVAPSEGTDGDHISTPRETFSLPLWSMYAVNVELGAFTWTSASLLFFYMLFANVALVNLLIAMFADSYTRVKQNADVEYAFQTYKTLYSHRHELCPVPPVLNLPFVLWNLVTGRSWKAAGAVEEDEQSHEEDWGDSRLVWLSLLRRREEEVLHRPRPASPTPQRRLGRFNRAGLTPQRREKVAPLRHRTRTVDDSQVVQERTPSTEDALSPVVV